MPTQSLLNLIQNTHPFESVFRDSFFDPDYYQTREQNTHSAPVNIKRDKDGVQIELYVPGYKKSDISIDIDSNRVTVTGKKESSDEYRYQEFSNGTFKRVIRLDETIDTESGSATVSDGVLLIKFTVKESSKLKQIPIK